jgi:hypothetical protein
MMAEAIPKLLTIAEAAELLHISARHLRQEFIATGIIAVVSLGKGAKGDRIAPADIDGLLRQRTVRKVCNTGEAKRGGSNSRPQAKRYADPLGLPSGARRGNSSAH